jgi:hypothetical protein
MSCGTERTVDQRLAGAHVVALVHAQVLALRHQVLALLEATFALDDDRALAARLSPSSTMPSISEITAGSLGRRASNSSVTRGRPPVMSCVPADLARRLGEQHRPATTSGRSRLRCRPSRGSGRWRAIAVLVLEHELRVQVALVLDHTACAVPSARRARCERLALEDVLVAARHPDSARIGTWCGSHEQSARRLLDLLRPRRRDHGARGTA